MGKNSVQLNVSQNARQADATLQPSEVAFKSYSSAKNELPPQVRQIIDGILQPFGITINLNPPKEVNECRFLDVRAATRYSSLSRWTLSRAVKAGELNCIKIGSGQTGKVLFDVNSLDRFLKKHTVKIGGANE